MWPLLAACTPETTPSPSPEPLPLPAFAAGPEVVAPDHVPLVRTVTVDTDLAATVTVTATPELGPAVVATSPEGTHHELALLGLRAGRDYALLVTAENEAGAITHEETVTVPPMPANFPTFTLRSRDPDRAGDGYVLLATTNDDRSGTWVVVVDPLGEPVWAYDTAGARAHEFHLAPGGHGVRGLRANTAVEVSWTGEELGRWSAEDLVPDLVAAGFHHELLEDGDRLVALMEHTVEVDDLPVAYDDPSPRGPAPIAFDEVVRFSLDGAEVERWPIPSLLRTTRIGWDSLDDLVGRAEWGHANGIALDAAHDAWVVSLRNQDALVSIDRSTGALRWILANPDNWDPELDALRLRPVGELVWPYHQHAPVVAPDGTIRVWDNGGRRTSPFTGAPNAPWPEQASRAVRYRVDEEARTVEQVEVWVPDPPVLCASQGNVEETPDGNLLVDEATLRVVDGVPVEELGRAFTFSRVVRVDRDSGEPVFDLEIWQEGTELVNAWYVYRAHHLDTWP